MQTHKEKEERKKPQSLETGLAAMNRPQKHKTAHKGSVRMGKFRKPAGRKQHRSSRNACNEWSKETVKDG